MVDTDAVYGPVSLRIDLAACYRLIAHYGWDDLIFTHVSARIDGTPDHFLINPYGTLFEEVTASNLVAVDLVGTKVEPSPHPVNPAGLVIHSAIHAARPDVACVLHTHTPAGVAVSAQKRGLLPISQQATVVLTSLAYHDFDGIALRDEEKPRLTADLGDKSWLILRNHGLLTVGCSVAEAFYRMYLLQRACEFQVLAQSGGALLIELGDALIADAVQSAEKVVLGAGAGLAWPALLRKLDRIDPTFRN